jgi:HAD superfamily hydrolase (TIGR01509 family)
MSADRRAGILLDVDGTLVDSTYLHTLAWSRALHDVGEWAPMHAIHRLVGMGADHLVPRLLGHGSPEATAARTRRYAELIDGVRPFPGAVDLVADLDRHGLAVVLATSSPADELERILEVLPIAGCLAAVTTADDIERSKPSPDVFLAAMEAASLDPARTLALGDSVWDVEAAGKAGIGCIAVESGGFSRHELDEAGARSVYRDVRELARQFATSPLALLIR